MADAFQRAWAVAKDIDGWLHEPEGRLLWELCGGTWCEVGSWKGRSAYILASTGHPGFCIDQFQEGNEPQDLERALARFDNVTAIHGRFEDSSEPVPALELLHLDADHSYEGTKAAWRLYAPKVKRGGYVVVHDVWGDGGYRGSHYPGVTEFVAEVLTHPRWEHVANVQRSAAFRRV